MILAQLAESRIREAIERGEFDDLAGAGKPVRLDDDLLVPEELRVAYRLLRNSGHLPPEIELMREIADVEALIRQATRNDERRAAARKLELLTQRLWTCRGGQRNLALERDYFERLLRRFDKD